MLDDLIALITTFIYGNVASWLDSPSKRIEPTAIWFWEQDWQAKEKAAEHDFQQGRFQEFNNIDDLIYDLMAQATTACQICEDDPNPSQNLAAALKRASQHRGAA